MNKIITFCILLLITTNTAAGTFNTYWISYPQPDSVSQIWFRRTYPTTSRPAQASITVTSTGNFELYVNQKNVSTDVFIPYRTTPKDNAIAITYDITRFLKKGDNVIAVWYSPAYPHINTNQISVSYYGRTPQGAYFAYNSDKSWICRKANFSLINDEKEKINGTQYSTTWNSPNVDFAIWLPATQVYNTDITTSGAPTTYLSSFYKAMKVSKIVPPQNYYTQGDTVFYNFDIAFRGWIRITIRGAKKGERINIDGLEYTCNGTTDEQAYQKFTITNYRKIMICGDKNFKTKQIQKVEGLSIVPYYHQSYLF